MASFYSTCTWKYVVVATVILEKAVCVYNKHMCCILIFDSVGCIMYFVFSISDLCQDGHSDHIVVFDLGMSSLTLSVLYSQSGLVRIVHSQSYPSLGGALPDSALVTLLLQEYKRLVGI